ncbi:DUF2971 domain-containing protein [Pigmentiphaga daeguensis]|uniref:DUF2971 domain-containing protein n=1 Tax=Pigmentiphaga daeguensis TaxID=414049 RepID=UPI0031D47881
MRVYHFVNSEYGLQNLRFRRLKIATINELNDPFELLGIASRDPDVRRSYLATKAQLAETSGMLCFSGNWRNPVQWSHYADRHRGLCLGFDVADGLFPVSYASKRLKPDFPAMQAGGALAEAHMRQMLTTKFSHWRYENEYRLFVPLREPDNKGLFFFEFCEKVALREVVVGHNSTITRAELIGALGDIARHVKFCKARLAFRSFRIVRQGLAKLWL